MNLVLKTKLFMYGSKVSASRCPDCDCILIQKYAPAKSVSVIEKYNPEDSVSLYV